MHDSMSEYLRTQKQPNTSVFLVNISKSLDIAAKGPIFASSGVLFATARSLSTSGLSSTSANAPHDPPNHRNRR